MRMDSTWEKKVTEIKKILTKRVWQNRGLATDEWRNKKIESNIRLNTMPVENSQYNEIVVSSVAILLE